MWPTTGAVSDFIISPCLTGLAPVGSMNTFSPRGLGLITSAYHVWDKNDTRYNARIMLLTTGGFLWYEETKCCVFRLMLFALYADFLYRRFRASGWCFGTLLPPRCRVMWLLRRLNEHPSTLIRIPLMETTWVRTGWLSLVVLQTDSISLPLDFHTHGQLLCFHYSSFRRATWRLILLFFTILHVYMSWFVAFPTVFSMSSTTIHF